VSDANRSTVESVKSASRGLRGNLAEELADPSPAFTHESSLLLKFHGIYQQDDRDTRSDRTRRGLPVDHICMVRLGIPGGLLAAEQYLVLDELGERFGNGSLRVTTRQDIQFHFVAKHALPRLLGALNAALVGTFAACGDVVRNTTCCPAPLADRRRAALTPRATETAAHFKPRSHAYYDLWVDGDRTTSSNAPEVEQLYGTAYLPRKFKIGFAFPGDNCIDVHSNDVGVVPVLDREGSIERFTVLVGGGMGRSHKNPETFPRLADPLTTVAAADLPALLDTIVGVYRDHGDRSDRNHARLKYVVAEWGIDRFREEVSRRIGHALAPPHAIEFATSDDHLGWHAQGDGRWFVGIKVENGRIVDTPGRQLRSALRAVVSRYGTGVGLTAREDILLTDVTEGDRAGVEALLDEHRVASVESWEALTRNSFACPALPTCGLALTESERVFPAVLDDLATTLADIGLARLDVHVRMTGCPNGCARPYTAEIGFVGRGKHRYDVHLGGDPVGTRLNEIFAENVPRRELAGVVRPVLESYRNHRLDREGFGVYCDRVGVAELRARLGTERWVRRS
jgi:sulfite reductase (ferredoxin)